MPKPSKPMHVLEIPIYQVDGFSHPREAFDKPFSILGHIHNVLVKEAQRRLDRLYRDKEYLWLLRQYRKAEATGDTKHKRFVASQLKDKQKQYGLEGRYSLQKYASVQQHMFSGYFYAHQIQKEAEAVYRGVEKVLYSSGKKLHFKKNTDVVSLSQKATGNGVHFNIHTGIGHWGRYTFRCHIDWNDSYKAESLEFDKISYFELKRKMFDSGWRYYLVIVFEGPAPKKITDLELAQTQRSSSGIDLGTSTVAFYSDDEAILEKLAPDVERYEKQIHHLQKRMDRLRRINNPHNYNEDGTIRKGRKRWHVSREMKKFQRQIVTLYRKKHEYIIMCHNIVANKIIRLSEHIYYEKNCFYGLQKKTKQLQRSRKVIAVKQCDGTTKEVHKYKKRKRFGHSLNNHAPSALITIIKNKCVQYKIPFDEINTYTYRASQLNPVTGEYKKSPTSERIKDIEGHKVQRDLLSAYLIAHPSIDLKTADASAVYENYEHFLSVHDACIDKMKQQGISFKRCFGF